MKRCTAKGCYAVVNFSFVMFWANVYCLWGFFLRNKPGEKCQTISDMHLDCSAVNSWLTIPTFSAFWDNLGKVEAISVLGIPRWGMPKTLGIWEWGCPKRKDAHITVTPASIDAGAQCSSFPWNVHPAQLRSKLRSLACVAAGPRTRKYDFLSILFDSQSELNSLHYTTKRCLIIRLYCLTPMIASCTICTIRRGVL